MHSTAYLWLKVYRYINRVAKDSDKTGIDALKAKKNSTQNFVSHR